MDIKEVVQDKDFLALPDSEKRKVLASLDQDFAGLSQNEQVKALSSIVKIKPTASRQDDTPEWAGRYPTMYGLVGAGKEVARFGGEMAALTGGAIAGAPLGIPGSIAGAGLAYGGVKQLERYLEGEDSGGTVNAIKTAGMDVVEGAAMEGAGQVIAKGFEKLGTTVLDPLAKKRTEKAVKTRKLYDDLELQPLPSEVIDNAPRTLAMIESVLGYMPVSGDVMLTKAAEKLAKFNDVRNRLLTEGRPQGEIEKIGNQIKNEAKAIAEKYKDIHGRKVQDVVDELISSLGTEGRYATGAKMQDALANTKESMRNGVNARYKAVGDALGPAKNEQIQISNETMAEADRLFMDEMAKAPEYRNKAVLLKVKPFTSQNMLNGLDKESVKFLESNPELKQAYLEQWGTQNGYTWDAMKSMRKDLMDESARTLQSTVGMDTPETRVNAILAKSIEGDMEKFAQSKGDDIWSLYSQARQSSAEYHEIFDKDVLGIMNLSKEDVLKKVVNNGEITLIRKLKAALGEEGIQPLRSLYVRQIFESAMDKSGAINTSKIFTKLKNTTPETVQELLRPEDIRRVQDISKTLDKINLKYVGRNKMETLDFLETITGTSNEAIVNFLFKPNNTRNIKLAKRLLPEQSIAELQQEALARVLKTTPEGNYLPLQAAKQFRQYYQPLKKLLDEETFQKVSSLVMVARNSQRVEQLALNASQTGQVYVGYQTARELTKIPSGENAAEKVVKFALTPLKILGLPWVLSKVYTSKAALKYLTQGVKMDPRNPKAVEMFTKAIMVATGGELDIEKPNQ